MSAEAPPRERAVLPSTEQPTPAGSWRRSSDTFTLPSGNVAALRKPQIFTWLAEGEIPNPLISVIEELVNESEGPDTSTPQQRTQALFWIVSRCFVAPVVVTDREPAEGELHVRDIDDADKFALVEWAFSEVDALGTFRAERAGAAGGGDGGDVGAEALVAAGDR